MRAFLCSLFFTAIFLLSGSVSIYGEGIKQLKPDSAYTFSLNINSNLGFGYPCFMSEVCPNYQKLFVRINSPSEKIFLGFRTIDSIRIKYNGTVPIHTIRINSQTSPGYVKYFKQAYAGPSVLSSQGYNAASYAPGYTGDFSLDFNAFHYVDCFDVTVIDTTIFPWKAIDGRIWSQDWDLYTGDCDLQYSAFIATQYIYTDDSIVTSIFYNYMKGWNFDVTSTSNGCYSPPSLWDTSCLSRNGNYHYAQYKIFVNNPDSVAFPTGKLGVIDTGSITLTPLCNGSVNIGFFVSKGGNIKINVEINPLPGHQNEDVEIMDSIGPGYNIITWNGLSGLGSPVPDGTAIAISMTYINGLTNLALYDVEKHLFGFVIQLVRPFAGPIATFWNDTLLRDDGGGYQLTGCYASPPNAGCHTWDGDAGWGLGSQNTVNTWWYAASGTTGLYPVTITRGVGAPDDVSGPPTICQSTLGTYTVVPDSLQSAAPNGYEWVLTDVATGTVDFDSINQESTIHIPFSLFSPGQKRLKVRGSNPLCGNGSFGPGIYGEGKLITVLASPMITNLTDTFSVCSGSATYIQLQSTNPLAAYSYTAFSTSPNISGYTNGIMNPIAQTLVNSGNEIDSVIYRIVPSFNLCIGDTFVTYVKVFPEPHITNNPLVKMICSGDSTKIDLTADEPGTIFHWTCTVTLGNITGQRPDSGTVINQVLVNVLSIPGVVTYHIIPKAGLCSGSSVDFSVTVNHRDQVAVTVTASANPVCQGTSVTFTATPVNGGSTPHFQWIVNGNPFGPDLSSIIYSPFSGDSIRCILTSSETCTTNNPASSIQHQMVVTPRLPVSITISPSANPVCEGTLVTFTAAAMHGGSTPIYQWMVNGNPFGSNQSSIIYSPSNGDSVRCILTSSELCVTNNPASSIQHQMVVLTTPSVTFTPCFDTITTTNAKPFSLKGGIPLGGSYSGPGISANIFYPTIAGVGIHQINYSYTNAALCNSTNYCSLLILNSSFFICGNDLIDIRDLKSYPTVAIGSQCWFASDLNYGTEILSTMHQRDNCIPERYKNPASGIPHPASFYQWDELMQYAETEGQQGLCPPGWHVPSESDWDILFANFGNNAFAGSPLKYDGYSGFNAELGGAGLFNKNWYFDGFATLFWSSTAHGTDKAWAHGLNDYDPSVAAYPAFRVNGFAVRCVKD